MTRAARRRCFLHIGTHKTGTTSIQRFLADNDRALERAGMLYPRTGRIARAFPGHHNPAFELCGDSRFDPALGTLAELVAEIAAKAPEDVCVSSEAFSFLHERGDWQLRLRTAIEQIGYRVVIVVYVRPQADYLESLYAELVKHGLRTQFDEMLVDVQRAGIVRFIENRSYCIDYTQLIDSFASVFGDDAFVVRRYVKRHDPGPLVHDFLEAIGANGALAVFDEFVRPILDNDRLPTGGVIRELFANTAAALGDASFADAAEELLASRPAAAAAPFAPLSREGRATVAARFARSNGELARRWGVILAERERRDTDEARAAADLLRAAEQLRTGRLAAS